MEHKDFIFCLEGVKDVDRNDTTEVVQSLEEMALQFDITSIYKACDSIEGFEESLGMLFYEDSNFKAYQIIYLVMPGDANNIGLNGYNYGIEEIAELFEGRMKGKVIHFANRKILDLTDEESQYFLDITGARAVSGYGNKNSIPSYRTLDRAFFKLFQDNDDLKEVVETMFRRHYDVCTSLDFRLYY